MGRAVVEMDGIRYSGVFEGFDRPFEVAPPDAACVRLLPWPYHAHMRALRESLFTGEDGLVLDNRFFASRVLAHSGLEYGLLDTLAPIALWWAGGGDTPPQAQPSEWVDLGERAGRARLRPWTEGERLSASLAARHDGGHGIWFDAVGYLDAMVRTCVLALDPAGTVDDLDSAATARLLAAVTAVNLHDPQADPVFRDGAAAAQAARATLEVCRALGWTPSQVWATPAAEIDRILHLLSLVLQPPAAVAASPARGGRRRLADAPDAQVFTFSDAVP